MKILFLDIDGVLNSNLSAILKSILSKNSDNHNHIDQNNLNILKLIVEKTDCKIVISSTWRKDKGFIDNETNEEKITDLFIEFFKSLGWDNPPIISITPNLSGFRGEEVATWLDTYTDKELIDDYIILDDDSDFIIGDLKELPLYRLDKLNLLDDKNIEIKSKYWNHQRLIIINKQIGLSYSDMIDVLRVWNPNEELINDYDAYKPYLKGYGKQFKS